MSEHSSILRQTQKSSVAIDSEIVRVQEPVNENNFTEGLQHLFIQPKLTVGTVGDPLEEEADAMADRVMRMPEQSSVQRKCAECEREEKEPVHRKPLSEKITPRALITGGTSHRTWPNTPAVVDRFLAWLKTQVEAELSRTP